MKKQTTTLIILTIMVIAIILFINYLKPNNNADEETMLCIAENSKIIVSPTCGACASQKQILEDNLPNYEDVFEIINLNQEIIDQYQITGVPTWIINEQTYTGVKTIEQLKQLTKC